MVAKGLRSSDVVFYGKVIQSDASRQTYTFQVFEFFKGKYSSKTLKGKVVCDCSAFPDKIGSLWLVYANFNNDKTINFSVCNPSIEMDLDLHIATPHSEKNELSLVRDSLFIADSKNENLKNWIYQFEKLRKFKAATDAKAAKSKEKFFEGFITISLIINVILFLLVIYLSRRKRIGSI
ncbi:hypothetical protein [Flavobacterium sp. 3HN19-14]|uniref:hypothetical protein n=1 Tax=Flavobacterium sp. 3HN19-14 TaxID=3448133 RepID=UPI003EE2207F